MARVLVIGLVLGLLVGITPDVRAHTPEPLFEIRLDGWVFEVAWNADETRIMVFGDDEAAHIFDAKSGKELLTLPHITKPDSESRFNWVTSAEWSPDQTRIATSGTDEQIKIWDATTGELLHTWFFPGQEEEIPVIYLYWSADGTRVYAFRNKHTDIKVWDAITGEALFAMVHAGPVYRVEWNADQSRIMTMGLPESKEELVAELEEEYPATFGLEEMIQMLDALALQTTVFIWDSASGELLFELKHPEPQVHDVRWSRDGTRVLTSAGIDLVGPFAALLVEAFTSGMEGSDTQPEIDMDKFQGRSAIRVWNTITGDIEFEIVQDSTIELDAWSPDETQIITDSMQGPLTIWDVASGDPVMELAHRGGVIEAEWEPTGTRILGWTQEPADCGLTDCTYGWLVWDATSGELILERYMSGPYNKSRVWNPDKTLAALQINESEYWSDCAGDACQHTVYILDSLGNEQLQLGHTNTVLQIQWNTSGTRLLTSEMDGMIRLWEVPLIRSD